MEKQPNDKKEQILTELGEDTERADLIWTMQRLDRHIVDAPSAESTEALLSFLKPIVVKESVPAQEAVKVPLTPGTMAGARETFPAIKMPASVKTGIFKRRRLPIILQLIQPQAMLLSKGFVFVSLVALIVGLTITKAVNGDMLLFLANASPVLGILTVFYEFRARLSGTLELEIACPYSPAQLATARLFVVLCYDVLLCFIATPFVSYYQGQMLWQVIVSWFAPLLLVLGIALAVSLRFGIVGGCLIAATVWLVQLAASQRGPLAALLLPKSMAIFADFISMGVGALLLIYAYLHWKSASELANDDQCD